MNGIRGVVVKFGIFVVVAVLILWTLTNTMLNGVHAKTTTYHAMFSDVNGLTVGSDVRVAGVRVGRVSGIEVSGKDAEVDLQVESSQPILSNATLTMRYLDLVGQRYIGIDQPAHHASPLPAGATIPVDHTSPGFDLTELLNGFRPLFQVLQPKDVNTLATSIVQVLQGEGGTVDSLLRQTATLTSFVADRDQIIDQVLTRLTPVLQDFAAHRDDLRTSIVDLKDLMTGLAKDRHSIGSAIDGISTLIGSTTSLMNAIRNPLEAAVVQLRASAGMLAASRGDIPKALQGFSDAVGALGKGTSYGNALNIYICSLGISVAGSPAINPVGGNPRRSAVCS